MAELLEIIKEWRTDSTIDENDLGRESLKIPKLHSKYYEMYMKERMVNEKLRRQLVDLEHIYTNYYTGVMDKAELKDRGLEQFDLKVLKADVPRYLDSTEEIIKVKQAMAVQQEKIDFIKSILQQIQTRSYIIRDAIEWHKFRTGY